MKTKKLFLMAAMLLASVCAFAQSVNNEPLRGDVNGDGKVDIADVTELVNIILNKTTPTPQVTYYWYVGKDESLLGKDGTSYNLDLTKLSTVSSINDIYSNSQSIEDIENNIYVVCPTEWVGKFKLTDLDGFEIPQSDKTSQIISGVTGYSILRGNGKVMDSIIKVVRN